MAAQNSGLKRARGVGAAREVQGEGPDAVEDQRSQLSRGRESPEGLLGEGQRVTSSAGGGPPRRLLLLCDSTHLRLPRDPHQGYQEMCACVWGQR